MDIYAKLKERLNEQIKKKSFDINSVTPETDLDREFYSLGIDK